MTFALQSINGPHNGMWFNPSKKDRWSVEPPQYLGQGVYPNQGTARGVASRLSRMAGYEQDTLSIERVEPLNARPVLAGTPPASVVSNIELSQEGNLHADDCQQIGQQQINVIDMLLSRPIPEAAIRRHRLR